jgi:hypothetical protein
MRQQTRSLKEPAEKFVQDIRRGQHRRAVSTRGDRAEPVLSLVERLPGGWQERCLATDLRNYRPRRGVPKDSIRRLLNHSGGDVTDDYIRDSGLGRLHAAEQETISAAIVRALGSPSGVS